MNKVEFTCPWYDYLFNLSYPIDTLVHCLVKHSTEDQLPTETLGFLHWDSLVKEVKNGGLGQYFFNRVQRGAPLVGMDEDIATHPLLETASDIMKEVLQTYCEHSGDLDQARESGEWPSEYFELVSSKYEALQSKIMAEDELLAPALHREILCFPENYLQLVVNGKFIAKDFSGEISLVPDADDYIEEGKLTFRNGYPHGPNILRAFGREDTVTISPNRTEFTTARRYYDEGKSRLSNQYVVDTKDFLLNRSSYRVYDANGVITEASNHTIDNHIRIADQWRFYATGDMAEHRYYSLPKERLSSNGSKTIEDQQLFFRAYWPDGKLYSVLRHDADGVPVGLKESYWPNGQVNTVTDMRKYVDVFDENGKSLLDDEKSGVIQVVRPHHKTGELQRSYGDVVNGDIVGEWRRKPEQNKPSISDQNELVEIRTKVEKLYDAGNFPPHYRPKVNDTPIDDDWTIVCAENNYQVVMRERGRNRIFTESDNLDACLYEIVKYISEVISMEYAKENPSETEIESEISSRILQETLTKINPEWGIRFKQSGE